MIDFSPFPKWYRVLIFAGVLLMAALVAGLLSCPVMQPTEVAPTIISSAALAGLLALALVSRAQRVTATLFRYWRRFAPECHVFSASTWTLIAFVGLGLCVAPLTVGHHAAIDIAHIVVAVLEMLHSPFGVVLLVFLLGRMRRRRKNN